MSYFREVRRKELRGELRKYENYGDYNSDDLGKFMDTNEDNGIGNKEFLAINITAVICAIILCVILYNIIDITW